MGSEGYRWATVWPQLCREQGRTMEDKRFEGNWARTWTLGFGWDFSLLPFLCLPSFQL